MLGYITTEYTHNDRLTRVQCGRSKHVTSKQLKQKTNIIIIVVITMP